MGVRTGPRRPLSPAQRRLLDALVRAWGPRLLAYVRRGYGLRVDPEEIVAETFCRAAANITAVEDSPRRELYLLATARNLCRDALRRRLRSGPLEPLRDQADPVPHSDDGLLRGERRQALLAAVDELPQAQREVVVLRLSAGLKFEEIAAVLGLPLGTALSRMNTALRRLRESLGCVHEH